MRRFAETFFRYWLIALVPIIVLPVAEYALIRQSPKSVLVISNIWVNQVAASSNGDYNLYSTPAEIEAETLGQLVKISSFDFDVARNSPLYEQLLGATPNAGTNAVADMNKNMVITAEGERLVNIAYTTSNWRLGLQVVQAFLNAARNRIQYFSQVQTQGSTAYYRAQLQDAHSRLVQSSKALKDYMSAHNIPRSALNPNQPSQQPLDPGFAELYQQWQSDQTDYNNALQQLKQLGTRNPALASIAAQNEFTVVDPPAVSPLSSKKKELMNLGIALVVGLLLGGGIIVVKTALDRSLRYASEVSELLDLPVLAVVPYSPALAMQRIGGNVSDSKSRSSGRPAEIQRIG